MGVVNSMEDVDSLLQIVDPHNNKQMTYSEIVQLLSSQMVPISEAIPKQVPLLEKFVTYMNYGGSQESQVSNTDGGANQNIYNEENNQVEWEEGLAEGEEEEQ
jgi:hypothetical protein